MFSFWFYFDPEAHTIVAAFRHEEYRTVSADLFIFTRS
jgi:hypothetical protein